MRQIRNIEISQKIDKDIQQGESCFKYIILLFVAACWLCKSDSGSEALASIEVHKFSVAAVGNRPYHTEPGQDASTLNLVLDWFRTDGGHE